MNLPKTRIAVLDNARALLTLLGIPFHCILFFCLSLQPALQTSQPSLLLLTHALSTAASFALCAMFFIQSFWMPCFFVLAGFVARLLCQAQGLNRFVRNRCMRIAIPFLLCWLWKVPLYFILAGIIQVFFRHNLELQQQLVPANVIWQGLRNLKELWFLYYLLWFEALTIAIVWASHHFKSVKKLRDSTHRISLHLFSNPYFYWLLAAFFSLLLFNQPHLGYRPLDACWLPSISSLAFYGLWYGIGWWLQAHQAHIHRWFKVRWLTGFFALVLYAIYSVSYFYVQDPQAHWFYSAQLFVCLLSVCYMVFGLLAMAWRYLQAANTVLSYLSQASYWIYLVQVPIISLLIGTFQPSGGHFYLKSLILMLAALALSLGSYQLLVRHTWLNRFVGQKSR